MHLLVLPSSFNHLTTTNHDSSAATSSTLLLPQQEDYLSLAQLLVLARLWLSSRKQKCLSSLSSPLQHQVVNQWQQQQEFVTSDHCIDELRLRNATPSSTTTSSSSANNGQGCDEEGEVHGVDDEQEYYYDDYQEEDLGFLLDTANSGTLRIFIFFVLSREGQQEQQEYYYNKQQ